MPKVKCAKCKQVISLDAIPADGVIQCTACGSAFRIRTKSAEQASSAAAAAASAPEPAPGAADLSFGNAAATPASPSKEPSPPGKAPASTGKAPDFGFLAGAAPPSQPAPDALPSFDVAPKAPPPKSTPAKKDTTANPKTAADNPEFVFAPQLAAETKAAPRAAETKPAAATKKPAGADEPPELPASPYTSPAAAFVEPPQRGGSVEAGELLALPAPSFIAGMFDGAFRYALTPRIVKLFWILSLVLAGIVLTLSLGGALLTMTALLMASGETIPQQTVAITSLTGQHQGDPAMLAQASPFDSPYEMPSSSRSSGAGGKLGLFFFAVLYQLLMIAGTLMWLLFVRMLLEAFCVLHGIRASVRTMAEQGKA